MGAAGPRALSAWRHVPTFAKTLQTSHGPVTVIDRGIATVCERYESPEEASAALEAASLRGDIGNIGRSALGRILPKYPEWVRAALLKRYWDSVRPELAVIAANPNAVLGEVVERRMRAQTNAAAELAQSDAELSAARCDFAFDDDAIDELAARGAELCRNACRSLGSSGAVALVDMVMELRTVLGEGARLLKLPRPDGSFEYARLFEGLASVLMRAKSGSQKYAEGGAELARGYGACAALVSCAGIDPPLPGRGEMTLGGAVRRMWDSRWWRRNIRKTYERRAESALRNIGMVSRFAGWYVSEQTFDRVRKHRQRSADYLKLMWLVNEHGEMLSLEDAYNASVSNPKLRRLELMARMAGCERFAHKRGDEVLVCTVTLPSRFHCISSRTGEKNPRFDGSDVTSGQRQLQSSWAKVRAALAREAIAIYGFRCTEPNHDGTIHWHVMICVSPERSGAVRATIKRYFLDEVDPDESGAALHRVDFIEIDHERGSAVGYLAKYISKNIDGEGVGVDDTDVEQGRDTKDTSQRVVAHARTNQLRQFQAFGLPSISVWRELRRLRSSPGGGIEPVWQAASVDKDFAAYIRLMGGVGIPAADRPVQLHYQAATRAGAYGELRARRIRGLRFANIVIPTREFEWSLTFRRESSLTWTRDNNCTHSPELMSIDTSGDARRRAPQGRAPPDLGGPAAPRRRLSGNRAERGGRSAAPAWARAR
jgi:hypothetical protein